MNLVKFLMAKGAFRADRICVLDVGAAGGFGHEWLKLDVSQLQLYGFEPNMNPVVQLSNSGHAVIFPWALGDKDEEGKTFYEAWHANASSFLKPEPKAIERYPWADTVATKARRKVDVVSFDSFRTRMGLMSPDYVKLDCEGSEYAALRGLAESLEKTVLAVNIEIIFAHTRQGQPSWVEIVKLLDMYGFQVYHIKPYRHARRTISANPFPENRGQTVWAQVLFFKDVTDGTYTQEQKLKSACMLDLYGFPDCAIEVLLNMKAEGADGEFIDMCIDAATPFVDGHAVTYAAYHAMLNEAVKGFRGSDIARVYKEKWHNRI